LKERYRKGDGRRRRSETTTLRRARSFPGADSPTASGIGSEARARYEIIVEGTRKGRALAQATMAEIRHAMKIAYKFE